MEIEQIKIGTRTLQPGRQLLAAGERVALGPRALAILSFLASRRGEVVTKDELFEAIWPDTTVEENALQVHVAAVRKALGEDVELLETVRGVGYTLHRDTAEAGSSLSREDEAADAKADLSQPSSVGSDRSEKPRWVMIATSALVLAGFLAAGFAFWGSGANARTQDLCVVPLEASGADQRERALASGISDELIARLRRLDGLSVTTRSNEADCQNDILKGSLQISDDRMRLVARLQSASGEVSWSETFDRELDDLFTVRDDISYAVSRALSVPLDIGIETREHGGTDNPEAYANYVRGRSFRHSPDRALPTLYLERALSLDPDYVKALVELTFADGITLYSARDASDVERLKARMEQNASRAASVAPDLWHTHAAQGWYRLMEGDFLEADRAHRMVRQSDPGNDPEVLNVLANFEAQMGRQAEAARLRAARSGIDPVFAAQAKPSDYVMIGEYDRAIAMYSDESGASGAIQPEDAIWLYWALRLSGKTDEAKSLANATAADQPAFAFYAAFDYAGMLQNQPFEQLKQQAEQVFGRGGRNTLSELASHASQLGNHRLAMDYLRLAFEERVAMGGYFMLWHPALAPTRATPEFSEFVIRNGLDDAWRESGDWGDYCRPTGPDTIACE